jgi:hypothetical protein
MGGIDLRKQCKELERKLEAALRERDDLSLDLQNMCLADSSTTFNTSSVLQERIYSAGGRASGPWEPPPLQPPLTASATTAAFAPSPPAPLPPSCPTSCRKGAVAAPGSAVGGHRRARLAAGGPG